MNSSGSAVLFTRKTDPAISVRSEPAEKLHPLVLDLMAEEGVDMAFLKPAPLASALAEARPENEADLFYLHEKNGRPLGSDAFLAMVQKRQNL